MALWIPGNANEGLVVAGFTFSAGVKYNAVGTMPLKTPSNGDAGSSPNHHNHKGIEAYPGLIYVRPVAPTDPITAFQGDLWLRIVENNLNPAYWRSDVTIFGMQGTIPVRGSGGTVTPGPTAQTKSAGYWSSDITIAAVPVPAGAVLVGTTIAGTAGAMPNRSAQNIHLPAAAVTVWANDRVFLQPPQGYYDGSTWVTTAAPQFNASNIRNGVNLLGITGTMVEGRRFAEGTFVHGSGQTATVTGLGFTPSTVEIAWTEDQHTFRIGRSYGAWYASQVTGNATQQYYINFANSTVFSGGFTSDMLYGNGRLITWRATE
ncbi:hypothetical protein [Paenibacillus sp. IHBB 3054]|uniref:hypothetical protein n=1 Tax=Paenibacillus sp. IHBB 3054 TaxID=3425689 RepID=UPI003F67769D